MGDGFGDCALGDLVEDDPVHGLRIQRPRIAEKLDDVPRDRLAFPVGVGREIERLRLLHRPAQGLDVLLVALDGLVVHPETVLRLHRAVFRDEIAHVPVRGEDLVIGSQVLLDGARLGGRFDDQEVSGHRREDSLFRCHSNVGRRKNGAGRRHGTVRDRISGVPSGGGESPATAHRSDPASSPPAHRPDIAAAGQGVEPAVQLQWQEDG